MMDALEALVGLLWRPWLAVVVLVLGFVVTFATLFVQVRALPTAFATMVRRRAPADVRWRGTAMLAAACGVASFAAGALAVSTGGRGALVWMWLVTIFGMAIRFGEALLRDTATGDVPPQPRGPVGRIGTLLWIGGAIACAITIGGLWQGHETAALLEVGWGVSPGIGAIVVAALAAPFVFVPAARRPLFAVAPIALAVLAIVCIVVVSDDPLVLSLAVGDAFNEAFGVGPVLSGVLGGGAALAMVEGVLRGTIAGMAGLGAVRPPGHDPRAGALAMVATLAGGLTATLGALVTMTIPTDPQAIVEPEMMPLERSHSRGLRPSQQVGQTVVLPLDSPLQENEHYALLLRGNPRGVAFGRLDQEQNAVFLPNWAVAQNVDEVVFRAREKNQAKQAAWDVRVPCNRELLEANGLQLLKLTPKDPELVFKNLIARFELAPQQYVPLDDFHFVAKVAKAQSNDQSLGTHLAMFEVEGKDRPLNPKLHEFFRAGYRGPYADTEGERPPFGWIATPEITAEPGTLLDLRLPASSRGEPLVRINRAGILEAPAWPMMLAAREVVLRHETDASQDIVVPVTPTLEQFRVRLKPDDPKWDDFRDAADMPEYEPVPYVRVPHVDFQAEVHGDARLDAKFAGRRSLVAMHPRGEPQGPYGELPYDPHPAEVVGLGMRGPVIARDGAAHIGARMHELLPSSARWAAWLAVLVLAIASIAAWPELVAGPRARPIELLVLAACAGAGGVSLAHARSTVDFAVAVAVVGATLVAFTGLAQIRAGRRGPFGDPGPSDRHS